MIRARLEPSTKQMQLNKKLSARQSKMLRFIEAFLEDNPSPPTVRDIQKACGISSTSVVDYNLKLLQKGRYIKRRPDIARGIELLNEDGEVAGFLPKIPLLGYISAGEPALGPGGDGSPQTEPIETIEIPRHFNKNGKQLYALKVKGQSMIDALIDDGDIILIDPTPTIQDGDMVVAWLKLEQETTLKRIYREGRVIRLQPENSAMQPIFAKASNVETMGTVVGVIRTM